MRSETIAGLRLSYASEEQAAAREIGMACERSVELIQRRWGLAAPEECRVYVMTSWPRFLFQSAPWPWKVYLILSWPVVARLAGSIWPYTGGWFIQYGRRRVVGVKPPRLIEAGNQNLGDQIFLPDRDLTEKVHTVTCHELVHAFTAHLKLPTWLYEGLATLAMEHYLGRRLVREDTLENLARGALQQPDLGRLEPLRVEKPEALIAQYARGYWLTRYIEEARPELLRDLLSRRHRPEELEKKLAAGFGKDRYSFWQEIDGELLDWQELQKEEARA